VNIVGNVIFIPRYGAVAAAWSSVVAYVFAGLLSGVLCEDLQRVTWRVFQISSLAVGSILMAAGLAAIVSTSQVVRALSAGGIYIGCCALLWRIWLPHALRTLSPKQ
jgi:O-antigen/teichoic acid export membrane protein